VTTEGSSRHDRKGGDEIDASSCTRTDVFGGESEASFTVLPVTENPFPKWEGSDPWGGVPRYQPVLIVERRPRLKKLPCRNIAQYGIKSQLFFWAIFGIVKT